MATDEQRVLTRSELREMRKAGREKAHQEQLAALQAAEALGDNVDWWFDRSGGRLVHSRNEIAADIAYRALCKSWVVLFAIDAVSVGQVGVSTFNLRIWCENPKDVRRVKHVLKHKVASSHRINWDVKSGGRGAAPEEV